MSAAQGNNCSELKPRAVPIRVAQRLLGNKARSELYKQVGLGNLDALKDGNKTLITTASIERYIAALPPAKIKAQKQKARQGSLKSQDPVAE